MNNDIKIAFDMDEVLVGLLPGLIDFHNNNYGTSLEIEHFASYHLSEVIGYPREEEERRVNLFFQSDYFVELEPIPDSQEGVSLITNRYGLQSVVTARPYAVLPETTICLNQYYQGSFTKIRPTNQWNGKGEYLKKSQVCKELGIDIHIDDNLGHAYDCAENGIDVLLFGDYPWNQKEDLHPRIKRVSTMLEAYEWIRENEYRYTKR